MAFGKRSDKDDNDDTSVGPAGEQAEPEDDVEAQATDDRDARPHQGALPRIQLDVFCAVEIDPGVAFVRAAGQR